MEEEMDQMGMTGDVDPVSGNEIPLGGTAEGVRDDVPANLSEGEYVVPAHVVKYFGIELFQTIQEKAEEELAEMDEKGQIGGQPPEEEMPEEEMPVEVEAPMPAEGEMDFALGGLVEDSDLDELVGQIREMADTNPELKDKLSRRGLNFAVGGVVEGANPASGYSPFNPQDWSVVGMSGQGRGAAGMVGNVPGATGTSEYKVYVGPNGQTKSIQFVDGKPTEEIPEGYKEQGTTATPLKADEGKIAGFGEENENSISSKDNLFNKTNEELASYGNNALGANFGQDPESKSTLQQMGGLAGKLLGGAGLAGGVTKGLQGLLRGSALSEKMAAARVAEARGEIELANTIREDVTELKERFNVPDMLVGSGESIYNRHQNQWDGSLTSAATQSTRPSTPAPSRSTTAPVSPAPAGLGGDSGNESFTGSRGTPASTPSRSAPASNPVSSGERPTRDTSAPTRSSSYGPASSPTPGTSAPTSDRSSLGGGASYNDRGDSLSSADKEDPRDMSRAWNKGGYVSRRKKK